MPRTLILSDLHLGLPDVPCGRPPRTPETLAPLFQASDRVILNGDTADIHHIHHREQALKLLDATLNLAARCGVSVTRINGNHDYDPAQLDFVDLFDGAILVTHGHAFSDSMLPWTPAHKIISRTLFTARERNEKTLEGFLAAAGEASMSQWNEPVTYTEPTALISIGLNPFRVAKVLAWWRKYPREAAHFVDRFRPAAKLLVCGHSHRAGSWLVGATPTSTRRHVINTGGFTFPSSPRAVLIDDSATELSVELRAIRHRGGRYVLDSRVETSCWRIQRPASDAR